MKCKYMVLMAAMASLLMACSPRVVTEVTAIYPAVQPSTVKVFLSSDSVPNTAQPIGKVAVVDRGFTINCKYDQMMMLAIQRTAACGGNGLLLIDHVRPDFGSACHQVYGTMMRVTDNKVDPSKPNPVATAARREQAALAEYRRKTKLPTNILMVNGGLSIMYSEVSTPKGNHRGRAGFDMSLEYERLWQSGWGVGANYFYNHTSYDGLGASLNYIGPSLVWSRKTTKGWRWDSSFGLGFSHYRESESNYKKSGFGVMYKLGVDYMLTDQWGIGAQLSDVSCWFGKDDFGNRMRFERINIMVGARYYF